MAYSTTAARMLPDRARLALIAALAVVAFSAASLALTATPAHAYDNHPCVAHGQRNFRDWVETLNYCPLAQGNVPVHMTNNPNSPIVGTLRDRGGNWFLFQTRGARFDLGGDWNTWWASTQADNGRWGWVNEVYFAGGDNDEGDGGLLMPGNVSCAGRCPELPPWRDPGNPDHYGRNKAV
jgi:hypothetical protein